MGDGEEGQSTVEFAAVLLGILAVVVALSAFVRAGQRGVLGRLAGLGLSHAIGGESPTQAMVDVLLF